MKEEITIGSIVALGDTNYYVLAIQTINNKVVPKAVKVKYRDGSLGMYIHRDDKRSWGDHDWSLVSGGVVSNPRERLYEKVRYLERKFKERNTPCLAA